MYHQFYGLRESPFGLTPDSKYLYASESHREALAHVAYGIEERRGFVLILGEVGTGKTTLIRHVLTRLTPDVKSVFVFNSNVGFEELLQAVLHDLEVPFTGWRRGDLIDALNQYLLSQSAAGRRVVLIIDEAQHLSPSVLEDIRMLSNLETARNKLLQIVLVGQPELGARLGQPRLRQLRQRIGLVTELAPLSRRDTSRYVRHRLAVAGCSRRVFTRPALSAIHRNAKGIPRLVNVLCDKSLVLGYAADKQRIGQRIVRQVARDWSVFRPSAADPSPVPPGRRRAGMHRVRMTAGGSRRSLIAAFVVASLLAAGYFGVQPRILGEPTVSRPPALPPSTAALGARDRAPSIEPAVSPPRVPEARSPAEPAPPVAPSEAPRALPEAGPALPTLPPSSDVLTVPTVSRSAEPPLAVVTLQAGDTLPTLLQNVYGRVDDTLVDAVQLANPSIDRGSLRPGQRLRFPPAEPGAMVHKLGDRRYVVHLFTTSDPMDRRVRKLSADVGAAGRMVRVVPVRLWTGCEACFRVWAGEFTSQHDAEAFYRRVQMGNAA